MCPKRLKIKFRKKDTKIIFKNRNQQFINKSHLYKYQKTSVTLVHLKQCKVTILYTFCSTLTLSFCFCNQAHKEFNDLQHDPNL